MSRRRKTKPLIGSGYIGAGNKFSVISRRAKVPFEKLKSIYGEELERIAIDESRKITLKDLSPSEKIALKNRIREIMASERRSIIISWVATIIVTVVILYLVYSIVHWISYGN